VIVIFPSHHNPGVSPISGSVGADVTASPAPMSQFRCCRFPLLCSWTMFFLCLSFFLKIGKCFSPVSFYTLRGVLLNLVQLSRDSRGCRENVVLMSDFGLLIHNANVPVKREISVLRPFNSKNLFSVAFRICPSKCFSSPIHGEPFGNTRTNSHSPPAITVSLGNLRKFR